MPPVLSATTVLQGTQSQALEHGPLLLFGIIFVATPAKSALVILIVSILLSWLLVRDASLAARWWILAETAGCPRTAQPRSAAIAFKVSLGEELDQVMLAMATDAAAVA